MKCNHDSGSVRVIRDKSKLSEKDLKELRNHFIKHLKHDFFFAGREYPYKGITPCIMAEKYMIDDAKKQVSLNDYKFYCFGGVPKIVLVVTDRAQGAHYDFFNMDFQKLDLEYGTHNPNGTITKPAFFEKMKNIAGKLSEGIRFVRIDLYEIDGKVFFGEYTFFDGGGFQWLTPEKWEYQIGEWIDLKT